MNVGGVIWDVDVHPTKRCLDRLIKGFLRSQRPPNTHSQGIWKISVLGSFFLVVHVET